MPNSKPGFVIPDWNSAGHLPPYTSNELAPDGRSPYKVSMVMLVERFGISEHRLGLLEGLLNFRAALRAAGIQGYQWINGSFSEDALLTRQREPDDIDVVTLVTDFDANADLQFLLDKPKLRLDYGVDHYPVNLQDALPLVLQSVTYWYGLWGHTRGGHVWKGFLEVELGNDSDADARAALRDLSAEDGGDAK